MKAVTRRTYGPPEKVLSLSEVDKPTPADGEVLIRVHATALNASDWEILTGDPIYGRIWGFFTPKIRILGSDIAGTVEAVGRNATRFRPGDAVYGDIFERWGGLAEWVSAPESMLRAKPEGVSFVQAASIPQSAAIALQGIRDSGRVRAEQKVLINGAGGGGGSFAIQIAKSLGAEVTGVDHTDKLELMRELGTDHVVDFIREDFTRNGQRYDFILDLVGHHSVRDFRRALAPSGRYAIVGGPTKDVLSVLTLGSLTSIVSSKKMGLLALKPNKGLDTVEDLIAEGKVKPAVDQTFPIDEAPRALRYLGDGRAKGKLVVVAKSE